MTINEANGRRYKAALDQARNKPDDVRQDVAIKGMLGTINRWEENSKVTGTNRWADGLSAIDRAVDNLKTNWNADNGASANNAPRLLGLLDACDAWLTDRNMCGLQVTAWRADAIKALMWQAALSYSADNFSQETVKSIRRNNSAGKPTSLADPVAENDILGNPYMPGVAPTNFKFSTIAVARGDVKNEWARGDSRDPKVILEQGGFMPANGLTREGLKPWFNGAALGGTISITRDPDLPWNAGGKAAALTGGEKKIVKRGEKVKSGLGWLDERLVTLGNDVKLNGFVYYLNNLDGNDNTMHLSNEMTGKEHVFAAIPSECISQWWANVTVQGKMQKIGPYDFNERTIMEGPSGDEEERKMDSPRNGGVGSSSSSAAGSAGMD